MYLLRSCDVFADVLDNGELNCVQCRLVINLMSFLYVHVFLFELVTMHI